LLWPRAAWLLVAPADRAFVDRALAGAAASFRGSTKEEWRWTARPSVDRSPGRVCVVIQMWRSQPFHGRSGYMSCFDAGTGRVVEDRSWL
jgi:hypothetical protein